MASSLVLQVYTVPASATHVTPTEVQGNPDCDDLVPGSNELKVDPPLNGVFSDTDGPLIVTVSNFDGKFFDWSSNIDVEAVFAKGGPKGNLYDYGGATSDTDLHSPPNNQGNIPNLSHISFCYIPTADIDVEKQLSPSKVLSGGQITVTATVTNTGGVTLTGISATDTKAGTLSCNATTLAFGASTTCTGTFNPTSSGSNTVTATGTHTSGTVSDIDTASFEVIDPSISVTKVLDLTSVLLGGSISITATVLNNGDTTLTGVSATDDQAGPLACNDTELPPGASTTCTGSFSPSESGSNTVTVTGNHQLGTVTDTDTADFIVIVPNPSINVVKTLDPTTVLLGGSISITATVTNDGDTTLTDVSATDSIAGTLSCGATTLVSGASTTCTGTFNPSVSGTNTVTASGTHTSGTITNTDTASFTVINPSISVTKELSTSKVVSGGTITVTATVTNTGNTPLTGISATDSEAGPLTCAATTLASGASTTCTGTFNPTSSGTNTVTASGSHQLGTVSSDSNSVSFTVINPSIGVVKALDPTTVTPGGTITITATVTNTGGTPLTGVSATDSIAGPLTCAATTLAPGASTTCTGTFNPTVSGTNTVTATGTHTAGTVSDTDTAAFEVIATSGLSIAKSDNPDPVAVGGTLTYTLTVNNGGPGTATGVVVTDTLPAGVTFVSAVSTQGTCTQAGVTVTCNIGTMADGASVAITITVTVDIGTTGPLENTATVTSETPDSDTSDNTANATTAVDTSANLSITKLDDPDPVLPGGTLTYTLTINNAGPSIATAVQLTDTLPAGVTFVSAVSTQGTCLEAAGVITCTIGDMAAGATVTVTVTVTVDPTTTGTLTNTAVVTSTAPDSNPADNTASADTTVPDDFNLTVFKSADPDPVSAGNTLTYTITATNSGPSTATNVQLTETLPPGVTFVGATPSQGTCDESAGQVICSVGEMLAEATVTVTILVSVDPSASGIILNTAIVGSDNTDTIPDDDTASDETEVHVPVCTNAPPGLVSWWPAAGNPNDIIDNNPGEMRNFADFGIGKVGQAFRLLGATDYVHVDDNENLNIVNDLTIDAWIKLPSKEFGIAGSDRTIVDKRNDANTLATYSFFIESDPAPGIGTGMAPLGFQIANPAVFSVGSDILKWEENIWYFVAVVKSGNTITFYRDGVIVGTGTLGGSAVETPGARLGIGAMPLNNAVFSPFLGFIDELEIFNRALSTDEIRDIYEASGQGKCKPGIIFGTTVTTEEVDGILVTTATTPVIEQVSAGDTITVDTPDTLTVGEVNLPLAIGGTNVSFKVQVTNVLPPGLPDPGVDILAAFAEIFGSGINISDVTTFLNDPTIRFFVDNNIDADRLEGDPFNAPEIVIFRFNEETNTWEPAGFITRCSEDDIGGDTPDPTDDRSCFLASFDHLSKFSIGGIKKPSGRGGSDTFARTGLAFNDRNLDNYDDQPPEFGQVILSAGSLKAQINDNVAVMDANLIVGKKAYPMMRHAGNPLWWVGTIPSEDLSGGDVFFKIAARDYNKNTAEYEGSGEGPAAGSLRTSQPGGSFVIMPFTGATKSMPAYSITASGVTADAKNFNPQVTIKNTSSEPLKNIRLMLSPELKGKFLLSDYAIKSIEPSAEVTVSLTLNGRPNVDVMNNPIPYNGRVLVTIDNHTPIVLELSGTIANESSSLQGIFMKMLQSKAEERYKSFVTEIPEARISGDAELEVTLGSGADIIRTADDELIIKNTGDNALKNVRIMTSSTSDHFTLDKKNIEMLPAGAFMKVKLNSNLNGAVSKDLHGELIIVPENGAPVSIPINIGKKVAQDRNAMYEVTTSSGDISGNNSISSTADAIIIRNNSDETIDNVRIILPREMSRVFSISDDSFKSIEPNSEKIINIKLRGTANSNVKQMLNNYVGEITIVSSDGMKKIIPVNIAWKSIASKHFMVYARDNVEELNKATQLINFLERNYAGVAGMIGEVESKGVIYMTNSLDELKLLTNAPARSTYVYGEDIGFVWSDSEDAGILALREVTSRAIVQSHATYQAKQKLLADDGNWLVDGIADYATAKILGGDGTVRAQLHAFLGERTDPEWYGQGTMAQHGASYTFMKFLEEEYGANVLDKIVSYLGSTMISNHRCDTMENCTVLRAVYDVSGLDIDNKRYALSFNSLLEGWEDYVERNYHNEDRASAILSE